MGRPIRNVNVNTKPDRRRRLAGKKDGFQLLHAFCLLMLWYERTNSNGLFGSRCYSIHATLDIQLQITIPPESVCCAVGYYNNWCKLPCSNHGDSNDDLFRRWNLSVVGIVDRRFARPGLKCSRHSRQVRSGRTLQWLKICPCLNLGIPITRAPVESAAGPDYECHLTDISKRKFCAKLGTNSIVPSLVPCSSIQPSSGILLLYRSETSANLSVMIQTRRYLWRQWKTSDQKASHIPWSKKMLSLGITCWRWRWSNWLGKLLQVSHMPLEVSVL